MLSEAQKNQWHEEGYIRLEGFFPPEDVARLCEFTNEVSRWDISDDRWMMWFEKTDKGERITSKVENFIEFHPGLQQVLLQDERITRTVEHLLDEKTRRLKELLIFKYPDSGGFRPHQDIYHIPHKLKERMVHAVVAVAIDDADASNGGLFFSPGQHKQGVFPMDEGGVILPEVAKQFSWEETPWRAGDIFIFDDYAPHYSLPNKSDRSRRTLYLVYQRASTGGPTRDEYNAMKRAYNPPEGRVSDLDNLKPSNGIFYRD
ncbi:MULTISPECIES: phytanoyl-CoA dioxygenase family protein [Pseudomonas]|uniref:Protein involved in biosynthesis of mitomycin antibiotics/polyketide fumonisin n=1 Tax=Pseudomonas asplenii TaxID=53407 RepID=A0A0N0E2U3_9PSED|nr:phytanoyl-CoA dioxygenase family protein [Pseudomonas fuscovaginae]KPA89291.1 protein involved in biosynthesis of mitomycin antibiotics/polyketide fumonisin [Pseudomonas fuscovaginae]KPA98476.1 protein involved in biosynthesis of mitomycin antibiotics/polyketide fumonisin [Pseudomonas fuscovaginae]